MRRGMASLAAGWLALCMGAAGAASPRTLIEQGNRLVAEKEYKQALEHYARAAVELPESAIIAYNRGVVLYRQADFAKAIEAFQRCASQTREMALEARARYNEGACLYQRGLRRQDEDLGAAIKGLQAAASSFQRVLALTPEDADAKYNIEVVRLKIKVLLDKQKAQQKQQAQKQSALKKIVERLTRAIRDQEALRKDTGSLAKRKSAAGAWISGSPKLAQRQDKIQTEANRIRRDLARVAAPAPKKGAPPSGQKPRPASPPKRAAKHVENAAVEQAESAAQLRKARPDASLAPQDKAVEFLRRALAELTKPKGGQGRQRKQPSDKGKPKKPPTPRAGKKDRQKQKAKEKRQRAAARDILRKEKRDREKRRTDRRQYAPDVVERDW